MLTADEAIEAVLEESGPDYQSFSAERLAGGTRAEVFFVTLQYRGQSYEVVIKFAPQSGTTFAVEPALEEFVAERTAVPLPGILVFESDPVRDVPAYFVTERISGRNLEERFETLSMAHRGQLMEQVGRILGDLHSTIAFEGFGRLDLEDDRLVVRDLSWDWQAYFEDITRNHIDRLDGTTFEDFQSTARECLEARLSAIPADGVPRLVHDDFRPGNLMFEERDPPEITAVLDWEQTLAGDPLYNLAQVEYLFVESVFRDPQVRGQLRERLYAGYRSERDFEADAEYRACKPLYQFSTLIWRIAGLDDMYGPEDGLARSRVEAFYRRQFDDLAEQLSE